MSSETETKTISRDDYYKLLGLATLAKQAKRDMDNIEAAMKDVLGLGEYDDDGYVVSDEVWQADPDVDDILRSGGFTVRDDG